MPVLERSLLATIGGGSLVAVAYLFLARPLLASVSLWRDYVPYAFYIPLWTVRSALGAAIGVFFSCEQAAGRFRYLWYFIPCVAIESVVMLFLPNLIGVIGWLVATEVVQVAIIFGMIRRRRRFGT